MQGYIGGRQLAAAGIFIYVPASLWEHFGSLWMVFEGSWADGGFRLDTMGLNCSIGSHFWSLQAALWVGLGDP